MRTIRSIARATVRTGRIGTRTVLCAVAALVAVSPCPIAFGQDAFTEIPVRAQFRDAVIDRENGLAYVAAYDRNEVFAINLATLDLAGGVQSGKGPFALALASDGGILGCVNRLDGTATLIAVPEMRVMATVVCGKGASDIAALPGGGFAVANSFSDSVTLIDARSGQLAATLNNVNAVPSFVAASLNYLAVAAGAPTALLLYEGGAATPTRTFELAEAATAVAALPENRFVVGTALRLMVVDAGTGAIVREEPIGVTALAVEDGQIVVLSSGTLRSYTPALEFVRSVNVDQAARGVAVSGELMAVLSPAAKSMRIAGSVPESSVAIVAAPSATETTPVSELGQTPELPAPDHIVIQEAEPLAPTPPVQSGAEVTPPAQSAFDPDAVAPIESPEPESGPEQQTEPNPPNEIPVVPEPIAPQPVPEVFEEQAEPTEAVLHTAEPDTAFQEDKEAAPPPRENVVETRREIAEELQPSAPTKSTRRSKRRDRLATIPAEARRPSRTPLGSVEPRAPSLGAPSASPLDRPSQASFRDALTRGLDFREGKGGFQLPDVSKPLTDVEADSVETVFREGNEVITFEGNARLTLDNTLLTADRIRQNLGTGELEAAGNVELTQGDSSLVADRVYYKRPPEPELGPESETEPTLLSDQLEPPNPWSTGVVEAENVRLVEPDRELEAEYIEYDLGGQTGQVLHAHGRAGAIYFSADDLTLLGPDSAEGTDVWLTTCDHEVPHYRIRLRQAKVENGSVVLGTNARLQLGRADTPVYVPRWYSGSDSTKRDFSFDFDSGRLAEIGYFLNIGVWTDLTPNVAGAFRVLPTTKEGVGFGIDIDYDYMNTPASPLFRSKGSLKTLYTTEDRGYTQFYHRHELTPDTIVLGQFEQWYDRDFVKDFFYDQYRDRTGPRTFVNITHRKPGYILTGSTAVSTHDFTQESEKLPELSFHLLEREISPRLYFRFDTIDGYYDRSRGQDQSIRTINLARLDYDWEASKGLNVIPFVEAEASWYSKTLDDEDAAARINGRAGVTAQSRFQRSYAGRWGFAGFKHIVVPSMTYFYRPEPSLEIEDTPQFDALDSVPGRSRIEGKIDNIFLGQDAETLETWQVARVSLYHGFDFQNEGNKSDDIEIEVDLRPRPWWGFQAVAEHHGIEDDRDIFDALPGLERIQDARDRIRERFGRDDILRLRDGDFDRILAYLYYDDSLVNGNINGRIGFAYTETDDQIFNREVLYGLGYRISDKWGLAFEHRYDLERGELVRQTYEIRRRLHCWDAALQFRDRESGFDVRLELSLAAFPGTKIKF